MNKEREQRKLRILMEDKCLLKIYEKDDNWTVDDAEYLCGNLIFHNVPLPEIILSLLDVPANIDQKIYNNCLAFNGKDRSKRLINSAINVCIEAATNPTEIDKATYAIELPRFKFLKKLFP